MMTRLVGTRRLLLAALALSPSGLQAQRVTDLRNSSHLGVGYAASIPEAFVGFTALVLSPKVLGGAGLYADVKFTSSSPRRESYFDSTISVSQAQNLYGDFLVEEKSTWMIVDLALAYTVTPELALYAGAGYSNEHHYQEYFDDSQTRGLGGFYWIPDPAGSGNRINWLGGALLRVEQYVLFQAGIEAKPRGATVGVMFTLPR
jgi:hypothetical protein